MVHNGGRPFECKLCDKGFTRAGNLKTHMFVHARVGPVVFKGM